MNKFKLFLIKAFCTVEQDRKNYIKYYGKHGLTKVYK